MVFLRTAVNVQNISYCFERHKPTDVSMRAPGIFFRFQLNWNFLGLFSYNFSTIRKGRHTMKVKGALVTKRKGLKRAIFSNFKDVMDL
jgi:hypothetical protein